MLLPVSVCVPARLTRVSVAAGMLTVTVPSAPVTGSRVSRPLVALPMVRDPSVPAAPNVGVAVQDEALPLVAFGMVPAAELVAFVPPLAIATVPVTFAAVPVVFAFRSPSVPPPLGNVQVDEEGIANMGLKAPVVVKLPLSDTVLPPMAPTVVARLPAVFVTSPVSAGI